VLRSQYEHAVAILIGKPSAEFSLPALPLTAPPPHIPFGLPSELLKRRPDIAAAERRVAAANAQIGVAKSAYYPLVNLSASGGFESSQHYDVAHWTERPMVPWAICSGDRLRLGKTPCIH
jgi:outer membrane protein TolC